MEEGSLFQRMKQIFHEDEMDEEMQKEAAALIRNIFRYMDKDAKDIMTHRKNIVAIDGDWSLEEALKFMLDERFSRFPVYQEDIDEIIGIIHLRDATSGYLDESKRGCPVKELKEYLRLLSDKGPEVVIITSVPVHDEPHKTSVYAYNRQGNRYWKVTCPYLPAHYPGTGDTFTSVITGSLMQGDSLPMALDRATQFILQGIRATFGYEYDNREGILLEKVLHNLDMPIQMASYELI